MLFQKKKPKDIGVDTTDLYNQYIRDMKRTNRFLNSIKGQMAVSADKISDYDEQIERLEADRERVSFNREDGVEINEERLREINNQIEELRQKREFQYEVFNQDLKPGMKRQVERLRGTLNTMLYFDRTLGERIRTLFREQGILVISILGGIASTIIALGTSIALGIKNAASNPKPKPKPDPKPDPPDPTPGPAPEPTPKPTPGAKNWIKQMLRKIVNLLIKLGDKALIALPGIIGAVVNFLLKSAASVVGFVAENLWTLLLALGALLYYELRPYLEAKPSSTKSKKARR